MNNIQIVRHGVLERNLIKNVTTNFYCLLATGFNSYIHNFHIPSPY